MDRVETIQAIMPLYVSQASVSEEERQERRKNWEANRAREAEDGEALHASLRGLTPEEGQAFDVIENAEGITYALLCAEHGKAATRYQQT